MFITQEQLNQVLDNYFVNTDGTFNQQYFDHSLQLILDNHHDLYDRMRDMEENIAQIAFEALRRFAEEACDDLLNTREGITTYDLIRWVWTTNKSNTYSLNIMDNTISYIINERREAEKEKEESTMKSINTIIDTNNTINENGDIICPISGVVLITSEGEEIEGYTEINGVKYFEGIVDDYFTICNECGEYVPNDEAIEVDGEYYCKDCIDEYFVECQYCGEYVRKDDAYEVDGDWCCENCRDEHCYYCEDCDEWHDEDNGEYVQSVSRWVCNNCLERFYTTCDHCGNYLLYEDTVTVHVNNRGRTEDWCDSCVENDTWTCDDCGDTYSYDVDYIEDGYDRYCNECGCGCQDTGDINTWKSPKRRMNYGFKPVPCMCATNEEKQTAGSNWSQSIVFYGFELEIDRNEKSYEEDEWSEKIVDELTSTYCKQDCSLDKGGSYSGIEIVSHPATLAWYEDHRDNFDECFVMLKDGGWLSHDAGTCGLHVHISLHALEAANPWAVNNMLFLFDRFWDKLVKFSRRTESQLNRWARRYSTARGTYEQIKNMAKRDCDRYMAVNLQNAHTVELRMFRGTLNTETFFATLQLVDTIVKRCIEIGNDVRRLQTISWEEFVASDHAELNAYLKRRGLIGDAKEQPEPSEQIVYPVDTVERVGNWAIGDRVVVDLSHNACRSVPEPHCHGVIRGFDSDLNIAVQLDDANIISGQFDVWCHDCDGLVPGEDGRWFTDNELVPESVESVIERFFD